MPGRDERIACICSMSAAKSVTAARAASFCLTHERPPMWASARPRFAAADVFLHQLDIGRGDKDFRPAVKLEFEMLFDLVVLRQQLQASIATDAVRKVDDVIPFAKVEEAVDNAAEPAAGSGDSIRCDGTAHSRLPAPGARDTNRKPACNRPATKWSLPWSASRVLPKISRNRSISASVWQMMNTSWPRPAASSSSRTLAISPENRSTLSMRS